MAGSPYTAFCYDFLTGRFIGSAPVRSVQFGQQLNAAGQFLGSEQGRRLLLTLPELAVRILRDLAQPYLTRVPEGVLREEFTGWQDDLRALNLLA